MLLEGFFEEVFLFFRVGRGFFFDFFGVRVEMEGFVICFRFFFIICELGVFYK